MLDLNLKFRSFLVLALLAIGISFLGMQSCQSTKTEEKRPPAYAPGLGEFMLGLQQHHLKLYYSGSAENWKLAKFEWDELQEVKENMVEFCKDRKETTQLNLLDAPLDSLQKDIETANVSNFKLHFNILTATCNACHQATGFGFNAIQVPNDAAANAFPNQNFRP